MAGGLGLMWHEQVTVLRPGITTDRGGNEVKDWSNPTRTDVDQLSIQPETQTEAGDATRLVVTGRWQVISAPGTAPDVRASDRIEWNGQTFEVDGDVAPWPGPDPGSTHHVEFILSRATG